MATCPRCKGPLTDGHRCPRGRIRRGVEKALPWMVGAALGVVVCYGLIDRPHAAVVVAAGALGALVTNALKQAVSSGV